MNDNDIDEIAKKYLLKIQKQTTKESRARTVLSSICSGLFYSTKSAPTVERFLRETHDTGGFRLLGKHDLKDDLGGLLFVVEIDVEALAVQYSRFFRHQPFKESFILEAKSPDVSTCVMCRSCGLLGLKIRPGQFKLTHPCYLRPHEHTHLRLPNGVLPPNASPTAVLAGVPGQTSPCEIRTPNTATVGNSGLQVAASASSVAGADALGNWQHQHTPPLDGGTDVSATLMQAAARFGAITQVEPGSQFAGPRYQAVTQIRAAATTAAATGVRKADNRPPFQLAHHSQVSGDAMGLHTTSAAYHREQAVPSSVASNPLDPLPINAHQVALPSPYQPNSHCIGGALGPGSTFHMGVINMRTSPNILGDLLPADFHKSTGQDSQHHSGARSCNQPQHPLSEWQHVGDEIPGDIGDWSQQEADVRRLSLELQHIDIADLAMEN